MSDVTITARPQSSRDFRHSERQRLVSVMATHSAGRCYARLLIHEFLSIGTKWLWQPFFMLLALEV